MNPGDLRNKLELYQKIKFKNELGEDDYDYKKTKNVFGNIIPANLTGSERTGQANTLYSEVTHRLKVRKKSITVIEKDMYFMYQNIRYDVLYWQPDFKNDEFWEIMLKVRIE